LYQQLDPAKVILVALRSPYDAMVLKNSGAYVCTYDCTKESIKAVARKLQTNDFMGVLPIHLEV
jgi:hypothetical protein